MCAITHKKRCSVQVSAQWSDGRQPLPYLITEGLLVIRVEFPKRAMSRYPIVG
jgi:hypothetical protein